MPILTSKSVLSILAVLVLSACEKNEFTVPVPVGGGGSGGGYSYSPPKASPMAPPATTNHHPMMQDPEGNLEDVAIEFTAGSVEQARSKCEDRARSYSDQWTIASCLGCTRRTKTTGKYMCTIRIETVRR